MSKPVLLLEKLRSLILSEVDLKTSEYKLQLEETTQQLQERSQQLQEKPNSCKYLRRLFKGIASLSVRRQEITLLFPFQINPVKLARVFASPSRSALTTMPESHSYHSSRYLLQLTS